MHIAVIGAGITGLTSAYRLTQKGYQVTLFEKENCPGGLAAGFKKENWDWHFENFFHHFFTSDKAAKKLLAELGLENKLFYVRPKTSIFFKGKIHQFDSPISVLKFPHLSFLERLRTGIITAYLKNIPLESGAQNRTILAVSDFQRNKRRPCRPPARCPEFAEWTPRRWERLEKITARQGLTKFYGEKVYRLLWQPLLKAKFGQEADKISMAWFWARIKKRSPRLGYIQGGFQVLINKLAEEIKKNQGKILLGHEVKSLATSPRRRTPRVSSSSSIPIKTLMRPDLGLRPKVEFSGLATSEVVAQSTSSEVKIYSNFDRIIVTTPTSTFLRISPGLPENYIQKLRELKMAGALNLIFVLKKKFLTEGTYWLNINEPRFPFIAVVEHTNFIHLSRYGSDHLLYVGGYYPQNHRYFKMTKKQILKEFLPYLQEINPKFNVSRITYHVSRNLFAQPIIPTNYSQIIPRMKTPLPNVFLANMQMVYPWDRGVNYAIELGGKVASLIDKN